MLQGKILLSGNQAIAQSAFENNVLFAAGYPGTPATEILEEIGKFERIHAQWSPNEKVALDAAVGASLNGARSLAAMKHVGLNVASDTLMTLSYTGVNAGLVIVVVDDPGMNSSQNEQDSRHYAKFAKIPMLEPSDSQEARDFLGAAFALSERFDTPVLLRISAKVAHAKSIVKLDTNPPQSPPRKNFQNSPSKYAMIPSHARERRLFVDKRMNALKNFAEKTSLNRIKPGRKNLGIITSGVCYYYAKEAFPDASFLKLGVTHPLPRKLIKRFAKGFSQLYVVEELDPFLEEQIKSMGIKVGGKDLLPSLGELTPDVIKTNLSAPQRMMESTLVSAGNAETVPFLCAGCAYLGVFYILKKLKLTVIGDIGCYSILAAAPFSILQTCISMGSGIAIAHGAEKVSSRKTKEKFIAVIGDSTFIHSGITPLIDIVYNKGGSTVIIFDNKTTAMTGGQDHPGTGKTLKGEKTHQLDYKKLVSALGIRHVRTIDCYNLKNIEEVVKREVDRPEPSVLIARSDCVLRRRRGRAGICGVDPSLCNQCYLCLKLGCPAIRKASRREVLIDAPYCNGCGLCTQICPSGAIKKT